MIPRLVAFLLLAAIGCSGCWLRKGGPDPAPCECEHDSKGEFNCVCPE